MGKGERPENQAPPEIFYNEDEARKYTSNTRMIAIQEKLTERAVELLALPQDGVPKLLLDLGCGSGLSSQALTDLGHQWIGFDISPAMLDVALEREVDGDMGLLDMGHGVPLRPGTCDGAISISAVQWLCNADKTGHDPRKRLKRFFETLYACLARGARAVLQVYPANDTQAEMMVTAAMRVGFSGGLVVDFPHSTRARKCFLVLMVGQSTATLPHARGLDGSEPMDEDEEGVEQGEVKVAGRQRSHHMRRGAKGGKDKRGGGKGREWVLKKKEQSRKKGVGLVKPDTKYTARKRRHLT